MFHGFTRALAALALLGAAAALPTGYAASQPASAPAPGHPAGELPLFAVEIRTGPRWDASKPPQEQALFREHSVHLRRLREAGQLRVGARYGDKGLLVLAAPSADEARALMAADPSMAAGTFAFELHPMNVFYGGELQPRPRR